MSKEKVRKSYAMNASSTQRNILQSLNEERKENGPSNCEVILLANGLKHFAHKIVLVTCSDFFRLYFENKVVTTNLPLKMFENEKSKKIDEEISTSSEYESSEEIETPKTRLERYKTVIPLPGIRSEEINIILEYMYTSKLSLTAENVNEILLVACLLQITFVIEFCAEVLIKQPNWRSPLVSQNLFNYVKNKTSVDKINFTEISSDLSTADTRTATSAKVSSFELETSQPQAHERLDEANAILSNRRISKVRSKHAILQRRNENTFRSKKYRHLNYRSNKTFYEHKERSNQQGFDYNSANEYSSSDSTSEITIGTEKPERKLIKGRQLHQSNKEMRAIDLHLFNQFPNTTMTNIGHSLRATNFQKSPSHNLDGISKQKKFYWETNVPTVANPISSDGQFLMQEPVNRSTPMFPQISDCSRTLAAAYASTLGVPTVNPKYFGFPIVNPLIYPTVRQTMVNGANTKHTPFGSDAIKQIPVNRYSGSLTAFRVHPGLFQNYRVSNNHAQKFSQKVLKQTAAPQNFTIHDNFSSRDYSQFASAKLKRYNLSDKETDCAQSLLDLTYTPRVKHFSPSVVQKQDHETHGDLINSEILDENNVCGGGENNLSNQNFFNPDDVQKKNQEPINTTCLITDHKTDIKSDNTKSIQKDYPTRKRKLLLGARNSDVKQNNETGSKHKVVKKVGHIICPEEEKIHYSSENDTDACETLQSFPKSVSRRPVSA